MEYKYTYQIEDFPNSQCNLYAFNLEIKDSTISNKFSYLNQDSDGIYAFFSEELSPSEHNKLNQLVNTHNINNSKAKTPPILNTNIEVQENDISYSCPRQSPLPSINTTYDNDQIQVIGNNGPDLTNVTGFSINWDLGNNGLYSLTISTNDGNPSWYLDLNSLSTNTLNQNSPSITFSSTGIPNFDGEYWVNKIDSDLILHRKTGEFTIYFSESGASYIPTQFKTTYLVIDASGNVYKSPVKTSYFGTEFLYAEDKSETQSSSTSYINKLVLNTENIPNGRYRININFLWGMNSTNRSLSSRLMINDTQIGGEYVQNLENTSNYISVNRNFYEVLNGSNTIELQYKVSQSGATAKIRDAVIELWRVS